MIPFSVLFIKATYTSRAMDAVSDGSSPSMVLNAAVHCLLMSFGEWQVLVMRPTNPDQ